ncbi:type IV secretion system protein [Pollutimonas bauzanensis]|uniref:Type IV secretion system protein VirB6 n=1 Tax=Pollutimonas bauzanensis TaxID=658167 RepID=A0A1M5XM41_9BURK|nr:type IV secretion system protein [Pollutimonas bauzanensis]SHI00871.1 type IV secretion system protein VirB6 [Pollutimonas bauzanensis]
MGIFTNLSEIVLQTTKEWADIPNTIIGWVTPLILLGLTISIMWHGYKIVRGAGGQDHLLDVFFNSIRTFLVVALCLTAGAYSANVVGLLQELRDQLVGLFSGGLTNTYAVLDKSAGQAADAYKAIWDWGTDHVSFGVTGSDISGVAAIVGGGILTLIVVVYCAVAAIYFIAIDFALAVLLAIGPLFLASLAFQATAQFFNTWFSAVLKYIMTAVVIAAVLGVGTSVISGYADGLTALAPEKADYIGIMFSSLAAGLILIILTIMGARVGAELAGGAALHIAGLAQAGSWAVNPAGAALSKAGKVTGAAAGNVAGRAGAAVAGSSIGKAMGSSRAMQYAMAGVNSMSQMGTGAARAMSHRSIVSAARAGFQSGGSVGRGTGSITK